MDRRKNFAVLAWLFVVSLICPWAASAQQVTYYNFDVPQSTTGQTSYACPNTGVAAGTLFCFNSITNSGTTPSYLSDTYPANVDPSGTNPNYAVQLTQTAGSQASSMWFSVPQQVSNGFNAYFAFRITPSASSYATADGFAFVVQNAQGGGTANTYGGGSCSSTGAGANIVGADGGCLGYGGIDNSVAFEFDTYQNAWDPTDNINPNNVYDDNHVAIQNCGAGAPNSPDHTGSCLVQLGLNAPFAAAINSSPGVTLADGNVHEVVISYSGPNEATPNLVQIYIDPGFNAGTHTPMAGSVPVLSGVYNLAGSLNLLNSTSAYVGFTSATGSAFEAHELLAWTFTPHTTVTQQQPLNPPGTPTSFSFGAHTYTVTYPPNGPSTSGINMEVTANTVTPSFFQSLVAGGPFQGSQCQVYDETGGYCVIYSVSCNQGGVSVDCPSVPASDNNPADLITVLSAFNNTAPLITPGFLQGDPLYTLITSITGSGTQATVTCAGECSVTQGQTVTVAGSSVAGYDGTATVVTVIAPNQFTYANPGTASATGGYLTSNNVQNIYYSSTDALIDSGVTGKTKQFSDLVVTSVTTSPTALAIVAAPDTYGAADVVTVTATSPNGNPTGNVTLTVDSNPTVYTAPLAPVAGGTTVSTASFSVPLTGGAHTLYATYATTGVFLGNTASTNVTVTQATPTIGVTGVPTSAIYNSSFVVGATTNASTTASITVSGACSITNSTVTMTSGTGSCLVSESWASDTNYLAASTSQTVLAAKAPSTASVLADTPNPSVIQAPVSLTFSVTGHGTPTGAYTVASNVAGDAVPTCTGALAAVQCAETFANPGSRTLTFTYTGDGNFLGSTATVQQQVGASAIASVSPSSLNFGTLYVGGIGVQAVTLTNVGDASMTINEPLLFDVGNGDSQEFIALSLCPKTLAAGKSCVIYVSFIAGPRYNTQTAILKIMDNAPGNPQSVAMTANVINPQARFSANSLSFGALKVGTEAQGAVLLTNTGATPLTLSSFSLKGADPADFAVSNGCPASLAPNTSCTLGVSFTPAATGLRTATLYVVDNLQQGYSQVPLSGTGK